VRSTSRLIPWLIAATIVSACSSAAPATSAPSPTTPPTPTRSPSALPSPSLTPAAPTDTPSPEPSEVPSPALSPAPSSSPSDALVGRVVRTVADDGLRVRTRPGTDADARKLEPLLPLGTKLFVLRGPEKKSGYDWFEVAPLAPRTSIGELPRGWVAIAGRDGAPWVAKDTFDCPSAPTSMAGLAALPPAVGVACFSRVPITVRARLISCNCDVDGSWYTPGWFSSGTGSGLVLVSPGQTTAPADSRDWFWLSLDPAGDQPAKLPTGRRVEVTGMFDHPAANGCTETEMDGEPTPSEGCRLLFAVTRLVDVGP
jgi:hypothetical protein